MVATERMRGKSRMRRTIGGADLLPLRPAYDESAVRAPYSVQPSSLAESRCERSGQSCATDQKISLNAF